MVYCSVCHKLLDICECDFRKQDSVKEPEQNKMIEPKKGTGKASKEVVQK